MNINVDDPKLKSDEEFQKFLEENPGRGFLKVRATSANDAVPVEGVNVIVSKKIGDNNVIFFSGQTDESGMINGIVLPTPKKVLSDEDIPKFTKYELEAIHKDLNFDSKYEISLCCSVSVIQYINITPDINLEVK